MEAQAVEVNRTRGPWRRIRQLFSRKAEEIADRADGKY